MRGREIASMSSLGMSPSQHLNVFSNPEALGTSSLGVHREVPNLKTCLGLSGNQPPWTTHLISISKTNTTPEMPKISGAVCQEPRTKTKYVFLIVS